MTQDLRNPTVLRAIQPASILAYLASTGWQIHEDVAVVAKLCTKVIDGRECDILVPRSTQSLDYHLRVKELLRSIESHEGRHVSDIYQDIIWSSSDVLSVLFVGATQPIGINDWTQTQCLIRDVLCAVACSLQQPQFEFSSEEMLEASSRIQHIRNESPDIQKLCIHVVSPHRDNFNAYGKSDRGGAEGNAYGRKILVLLFQILESVLRMLADPKIFKDSTEFYGLQQLGASANLLQALVDLGNGFTGTKELHIAFRWASPAPIELGRRGSFELALNKLRLLREVIAEYRENAELLERTVA